MRSGIVIIDKPSGMTSHDVVRDLRKIYQTKKVGHTGTLDPNATGVLPVCIGQATRLAEYVTDSEKVYQAKLQFGAETETQDSDGETIQRYPLPSLSLTDFEKILEGFLGDIRQTPTMYSAIKYKGKPLYKYAREGIEIPDLPDRQVHIYNIKVLEYSPKSADLLVTCSKGTYIRTLCQDIARACQSGGFMSELRRLKTGSYTIEDSVSLNTLRDSLTPDVYIKPMVESLNDVPTLSINAKEKEDLSLGRSITNNSTTLRDGLYQAIYEKSLIAIGYMADGVFSPKKVFQQEGLS